MDVEMTSLRGEEEKQAKIIIIGTGFGGLATAIRLKQKGEEDFIILERDNDVGGVWRDNRYPGSACDVESHLYSFSFAPNPNWSRKFSGQAEIHKYLKDCVSKLGLLSSIRFNHEVTRMDWHEEMGEWVIQTTQGEFKSQFVVGGFGALSDPDIPNLKGREDFQGTIFHSATWPKGFDPKGKNIAVIGTGASAIQFIPKIQPDVAFMHIFQRTPPWVVPRHDGVISLSMQKIYERLPWIQKSVRLGIYLRRELMVVGIRHQKVMKLLQKQALKFVNESIEDPALKEKATPNYLLGCKRILLSNTYYPAITKPNVNVNTAGIIEVTKNAIIDGDGNEIKVDTIIFGMGFKVKNLPFTHYIYGKDGCSLADTWAGNPKAYAGTTVSGFPNLFLLQGPNTGLGHSSVIYMIEAQIEHILKVMIHMKNKSLDIIEPYSDAQERFFDQMQQSMQGTVWTEGGCNSWYLDQTGQNSTLWPSYTFKFRKLVSNLNTNHYKGRKVPFVRE